MTTRTKFSISQMCAIADVMQRNKPNPKQYTFGSPNFASDAFIWQRTVNELSKLFTPSWQVAFEVRCQNKQHGSIYKFAQQHNLLQNRSVEDEHA